MTDSEGRTHVILVPGFGGFDALGQIEYYAGTTALFERWRKAAKEERAVLHYFDNIPTAGVVTRARELKRFLAKLVKRNVVGPKDELVLIGHSTGGLDIRQLLVDLTGAAAQMKPSGAKPNVAQASGSSSVTYVDGGQGTASLLEDKDLRRRIRRVVFLSVPQRGTNIADWLRVHPTLPGLLARVLGGLVDIADAPLLEQGDIRWLAPMLQRWRDKYFDPTTREEHSGWLAAAFDVHAEMSLRRSRDANLAADARDARSDFQRWLNGVEGDFLAIGDLSAGEPSGTSSVTAQTSLTRLDDADRQKELQAWQKNTTCGWREIDVRSYATIARCPFRRDVFLREVEKDPGRLHGFVPRYLKHVVSRDWVEGSSDALYRLTYWLCATGPLAGALQSRLTDMKGRPIEESVEGRSILPWNNDGIVNTASMLWPNGRDTRLIDADHGDIIGHYAFSRAAPDEPARKYQRYDFFKSADRSKPYFDDARFKSVWFEIFDYAVFGENALLRPTAAESNSEGPEARDELHP
jgi:hypothetical protein